MLREPPDKSLEFGEAVVIGESAQGQDVRGRVISLKPGSVVFEILDSAVTLRLSEVLTSFQLLFRETLVFEGRAVVSSLTSAGSTAFCEVKFGDGVGAVSVRDVGLTAAGLGQAFARFHDRWQAFLHVPAEFRLMVTEMESLFDGLRQWLEQVEFALTKGSRRLLPGEEQEIIQAVAPRAIAAFDIQRERFEEMVDAAPPEERSLYESFVRQRWLRLFLSSPFGHRTFHKPLGYAGDYEMMNMIHRNRPEGGCLFEKLVHFLLVSQWPAASVRNRIAYLRDRLVEEGIRMHQHGYPCRVLNIGCGPAQEIQYFLRDSPASDRSEFVLVDFNEETLAYAKRQVEDLARRHERRVTVETRHLSVYQLLRRGFQTSGSHDQETFDVIYCAGLFDYLADETCRCVVDLLYRSLEPGGLLLAANMKNEKPFRVFIEFVLDWHLIYRDARCLRGFAPSEAMESCCVEGEETFVNLFLKVRKPS